MAAQNGGKGTVRRRGFMGQPGETASGTSRSIAGCVARKTTGPQTPEPAVRPPRQATLPFSQVLGLCWVFAGFLPGSNPATQTQQETQQRQVGRLAREAKPEAGARVDSLGGEEGCAECERDQWEQTVSPFLYHSTVLLSAARSARKQCLSRQEPRDLHWTQTVRGEHTDLPRARSARLQRCHGRWYARETAPR